MKSWLTWKNIRLVPAALALVILWWLHRLGEWAERTGDRLNDYLGLPGSDDGAQ